MSTTLYLKKLKGFSGGPNLLLNMIKKSWKMFCICVSKSHSHSISYVTKMFIFQFSWHFVIASGNSRTNDVTMAIDLNTSFVVLHNDEIILSKEEIKYTNGIFWSWRNYPLNRCVPLMKVIWTIISLILGPIIRFCSSNATQNSMVKHKTSMASNDMFQMHYKFAKDKWC